MMPREIVTAVKGGFTEVGVVQEAQIRCLEPAERIPLEGRPHWTPEFGTAY